jgi:hypothetical protein
MTFASLLITIIGVLAIGWYYLCLLYLAFLQPSATADDPTGFREFMALSVSTLSGTLATFVGMLLGVQTASSQTSENKVTAFLAQTPISKLQMAAAIAYVVSLVIALVAWGWNQQGADTTIVALARSFLGLIGGALAVVLNVAVK